MPDVVVVGGGPAGSACALVLARAGIAVTIVERAVFPRRKVCGEYVNAGALQALDELNVGTLVRAHSSELAGLRLVPPDLEPVDLDFPSPARALPRSVLDDLLLGAAREAGAQSMTARVEDLAFEDGRVTGVVLRDRAGALETLNARYVVGADGSGSLVARKLGLVRASRGPRRFALGGHYRGFGGLDARVEMYVGGGAYFAINPLDHELANVMVVVRERQLADWSAAVDEGMRGKAAQLARGRRSFASAERVGARVSCGPLAFQVTDAARPGALLAGDASGFLNPFTGQGVYLALRGGTDAGATLVRALAEPMREAAHCRGYSARRGRELAARRRLSKAVDLLVDVPLFAARAAGRLRRMPELGRTLLEALSGTAGAEFGVSPLLLGRLLL